jgi:hypothetical protein
LFCSGKSVALEAAGMLNHWQTIDFLTPKAGRYTGNSGLFP